MRVVLVTLVVCLVVALAYAGESASWWDLDAARIAGKVELKMHATGVVETAEYHVTDAEVPPIVIETMTGLYSNLLPEAEKGYENGTLYYELSAIKDGKKVEVLFTPGGELFRKEIEVDPDASPYDKLPGIRDALLQLYEGAEDVVFEAILSAGDQLVEFHVKLTLEKGTSEEQKYKLIVTKDGFLAGAYLEVVAELEVPIPARR